MINLNICTFNVRGLNNDSKRKDVFNYLSKLGCHIYCLQDIHCSKKDEANFRKDWEGDMVFSHGASNARGVAILFSKNFELKITESKIDPNGNYVALKLNILDTEMSVITLYGPNIDSPLFFNEINNIVDEFQTGTVLICGDWNLVQDQELDTKYYVRENNVRAREIVKSIIENQELVDPWRNNNPLQQQFTWFQHNPVKMSRLDFFLISSDLMNITEKVMIKSGYRSDHSLVILRLCSPESSRGNGFWKLNTLLLNDMDYVHLVNDTITENIQKYAQPNEDLANPKIKLVISDQLFFEMVKMEVRKVTMTYASRKKRDRDKREGNIISEINKIESNLASSDVNLNLLSNLKKELENIRMDKVKGLILRTKVKWLEEGEKPTKFFATLEKRNYINKLINKVDDNGKLVTEEKSILNKLENFYKNLYETKTNATEHQGTLNTFLNDTLINKLDEEQKQACEGEIRIQEVKEVLKSMKNGKTPGIDGLPIEFYKCFWVRIGHFLLRSLNEAFYKGELSVTQKRGIITCIPKGNKPREYMKNWRPISLLSTDYKILTSILANRMKTILGKIISQNQKGFLKGRFIEENTRAVYDIIQYCKDTNKNGLLLLIDFEKAFDSLEWSYMKKVLLKYNFGPNYVKWFDIAYKNAQSCVINNGKYSSFFNLGRGCRQGDPWSPYLFLLAIEPLAQYIEKCNDIQGLSVGNKQFKIGQYADDTFLVLDGSERSVRMAMNSFELFKLISGLRINIEKTQAINLNPCMQRVEDLGLQYTSHFKLLGIHFSTHLPEMDMLNFKPKIGEIRKIIKLYSWRNLSLAGRITIVKMLLLPKLVHLLAVLPTPNKYIMDELHSLFVNFVWNNKRPKVKMNTLVQDIGQGGLKMLHVESFSKAMKLSWVNRMYNTTDSNIWKHLALQTIQEQHLSSIFESSDLHIKLVCSKINNLFWKEVLVNWGQYKDNIIKVPDSILVPNQCIWDYKFIKNHNLLIRRNYYMSKGLIHMEDLFDYNENRFKKVNDLNESYNIQITPFDYFCLVSSIPKSIKTHVKNYKAPQNIVYNPAIDRICTQKKPSRHIYKTFIKDVQCDVKSKTKWNNELASNIDEQKWQSIFSLPNNITQDAALRIFQYKILHRILPTNKLLTIYGMRDNANCEFCTTVEETLIHMFHTCPTILTLWYEIAEWLAPEIDIYHYINSENILLGIGSENAKLPNSILLFIKRYIFISKCKNSMPTLAGSKIFLKNAYLLETSFNSEILRNRMIDKWESLKTKLTTIQ